MSQNLQIGSTTYKYPLNSETGGTWGEDASAWAKAITDKVNGFSSNSDILTTSASLSNNVVVDTAVSGLSFNSTLVRAATVTYDVIRTAREYGTLLVNYNGSSWDISRQNILGDAGMSFNITAAGQVTYQSSNDIVGTMKFSAKAIEV